MRTVLTTSELINLVNSRYSEFLDCGGNYSSVNSDVQGDATAYNHVISTLKDVVESFSDGRLKIVAVN